MQIERFKQLVERLEKESAAAPGLYRAKVAALALLGFGILALLIAAVGFGLVLLIGIVVAMLMTGGAALLVLLKFGKLLLLLALPLWFLMKSAVQALFVRLPAPDGREIVRADAPALFAVLDDMRVRLKGPPVHHVRIIDEMNAAVLQRPAFGLIGPPRNHLLLGLPLLEALPPAEALAVVGHEYGHLAGAHGRFSAYIYRLRKSWGVVQDYAEQVQGWLGRMVAPLVTWYAPYFNAYTFVLARANEFQADAASVDLVGAANAAHALKRVNVTAPRLERYLSEVYARIDHDEQPPRDLLHRWSATAGDGLPEADARRWLADALDREGQVTDTHPTLRARLSALNAAVEPDDDPPPEAGEPSAAAAWLGPMLPALHTEFDTRWADQVATRWAEQHAQARQRRARLAELRAVESRDAAQELEMLQLALRLEPDTDLREPLAAFNTREPDHPLGLFLEGTARLGRGDRDGLALLDRAMALDAEATKPCCERAHAFLAGLKDTAAAEAYAERWRARDRLETLRAQQLERIDGSDTIVDADIDDAQRQALRQLLDKDALRDVARVHVARRVIPADPGCVQILLGVELGRWGRWRGRQQQVVQRLARIQWPLPMVILNLEGRYAKLRGKFHRLPQGRLH